MPFDNEGKIREIFKSEFSREKVEKMDSFKYSKYLRLVSEVDDRELMSENVDLIADRFKNDILNLSQTGREEDYELATKIGERTEYFLWSAVNIGLKIKPEILEDFYSGLESDNQVIRDSSVNFVSNLVCLDSRNKKEGEKFLDLYNCYMDNLVRIIKEPKNSKEKSMIGLMVDVVYGDFGKDSMDRLLKGVGIDITLKNDLEKENYKSVRDVLTVNSDKLNDDAKNYLGTLLLCWKESYDKSEGLLFESDYINKIAEDYWDKKAMKFRDELFMLMSTKDDDNPWLEIIYGDNKTVDGIEVLKKISTDPSFKQKGLLATYLAYEVWLSNRPFELSPNYCSDEELIKLNNTKDRVYPNISEITINLLHENDLTAIENYMASFASIHETKFADSIIIDERLNLDEKIKFMVCFMNNFGVMKGIDFLAKNIEKSEDIEKVYDKFQGKDLKKRFTELKSLYSDVDFEKYNSPEFTKKEVKIIKDEIEQFSIKNKERPNTIKILDIGAGTGRHCVALHHDGYEVTALEVQPNHVERIRLKDPYLTVIQKSWFDLKLDSNDDAFDFAYCLERTVLHNQTPQDMLKFFDNISQVLSENGRLMIDFADTTVGEYQDRVNKYKDNLRSLGVKKTVVQHIFDGVDDDHQFNRMAPTKEQIEAYIKLVGLKLVKEPVSDVVEKFGEITNTYYIFEKDPNFYPDSKSIGDIKSLFREIGIFDEGVDYNQMIKSLGMTIGQLIIYGVDNESVRVNNYQKNIPNVSVTKNYKGELIFETSRDEGPVSHFITYSKLD